MPDLRPAAVVGLQTPLGELLVGASDDGVVAAGFEQGPFLEELNSHGYEAVLMGASRTATDVAEAARTELAEYFERRRTHFQVPIHLENRTAFGRAVLKEVATEVPFATTVSYGEVGERAGRMRAGRAVGNIMATCPFSVIVPCHRVVHSTHASIAPHSRKAWLLRFEREVAGLHPERRTSKAVPLEDILASPRSTGR
ncbi:MAG TPA: methylated-DNA--[protein]-cysteine S-methyltransferase [Chloroflexota bacterium]|nr:methylated-DNA--[protein]-cysteine S-methyltransferase [Chloroflexota bacterium]